MKKKFLVVGIGLNLNKSPKIKNYQTNFINFFTKKNVTRLQIFKLLCNSYEKKIKNSNSIYIVGDIGNTDTKIFLVNHKFVKIKKIF